MEYIIVNREGKILEAGSRGDDNLTSVVVPADCMIVPNVSCSISTHYYSHTKKSIMPIPPKLNGIAKFNYSTEEWESDDTELALHNRKKEYPAIGDQLDMLYHAMKNGEIPVATEWFNTIEQIKDKYPKEINNG